MTLRKLRLALAAICAGSTVLSACASVDKQEEASAISSTAVTFSPSSAVTLPGSTTTTLSDEPEYLGRVTSIQRLDGGDIVVSPPTASQTPKASWQTAFGVCSDGTGVCVDSSLPVISVGDVITKATGDAGANGTIIPLVNNSLTYILRWDNVVCPPSAGPTELNSDSTTAEKKTCTLIDLVDAESGKYVFAFEGPFVG